MSDDKGKKGKNSIDDVTKELSDVTDALKKTDAEMESIKKENAELAESVKSEQDKSAQLEKDKSALEENYKKLQDEVAEGASDQYKELEENRDNLALELAKEKESIKELQGLLEKERSKPAGIAELDSAKAELAKSREKIANINQLEAELDLARKRVASYEDTNLLQNTDKPIKLPPGFGTATVQLIPFAYYEVDFDGSDKKAKALLLGDNKPSMSNTVILFVEGETPVRLENHVIRRHIESYTHPENGEVFKIDRVVVEPQKR